jgi:N-acyl homoserine lactone hydrolase
MRRIEGGEGMNCRARAVARLALLSLFAIVMVAWVMNPVGRNQDSVWGYPAAKSAVKSLQLYVFDCGHLVAMNPADYGVPVEKLARTDFSVACFLIVHPKGTLMWDVGVLPDDVLASGGPVTQGRATVRKTLSGQLAEIGYKPEDIKYLVLSHDHWDHTANAREFAASTWIVEKADRDAMFADPPPKAFNMRPEYYEALRNSKTILLHGEDYDVFGDGSVVIKPAPGHSAGHQVLFLKLKNTGPVVLSGDLYHYPEERTLGAYPKKDDFPEQTVASRAKIEEFLKANGAQLWIQHDIAANEKLKKSPAYYD